MRNLFNNNGSLGAMIIVMIGILVLLTVFVVFRLKRYIDGAKTAGDSVMVLERPVKNAALSASAYIFIAYFLNGHGICMGSVDLSALLVLALGAINFSFDIKPQVICDYGIMTANGLVPWEVIAEILRVDEKNNIIVLRLTQFVRESEMKLFCPVGKVHKTAEIIESKIHKEA